MKLEDNNQKYAVLGFVYVFAYFTANFYESMTCFFFMLLLLCSVVVFFFFLPPTPSFFFGVTQISFFSLLLNLHSNSSFTFLSGSRNFKFWI